MRVASIQLNSQASIEDNLQVAASLLAEAARAGCDLAVLPENFSLMTADDGDRLRAAEREEDSRILDFLRQQASGKGLAIIGGSTPLSAEVPGKMRNACAVFDADGRKLGVYDKIHLFDVDLEGERYRESATVVPGDEPKTVQIGDWRVGLSICYDLRFPELFRCYAGRGGSEGVDAISVVAAFTVPTGRAHWRTLLAARAIENQCYVFAAAQWGEHDGGRKTWGHSMIIDPWGEVIAEIPEGVGLTMAEVSHSQIRSVRRRLPALSHRVL